MTSQGSGHGADNHANPDDLYSDWDVDTFAILFSMMDPEEKTTAMKALSKHQRQQLSTYLVRPKDMTKGMAMGGFAPMVYKPVDPPPAVKKLIVQEQEIGGFDGGYQEALEDNGPIDPQLLIMQTKGIYPV